MPTERPHDRASDGSAGNESSQDERRVDVTARRGMLPSTRMALVTACAVVIIGGMKLGAEIVAPIILGFVIATAIAPIFEWLRRKGMPSAAAYTTTLVGFFGIAVAIILLLTASLANFAESLPGYKDQMQPYLSALAAAGEKRGIDTQELFTFKNVSSQSLVKTGVSVANGITGAISGLGLVAFLLVFMLLEVTTINRKIEAGLKGPALDAAGDLRDELRAFVKVSAFMGAIAAVFETILLLILGVPNAILWGLLAFFFSFIPYVGFILALVPPALLALLTSGWIAALVVVGGYIAINTLSDSVFKPHIMGSRTNLSQLAVFLSIVVWGWALGPLGGLLAVPITLILKGLVFKVYPEWNWLAILLSTAPAEKPPPDQKRTQEARRRARGAGTAAEPSPQAG